jgi:hypothetical protein
LGSAAVGKAPYEIFRYADHMFLYQILRAQLLLNVKADFSLDVIYIIQIWNMLRSYEKNCHETFWGHMLSGASVVPASEIPVAAMLVFSLIWN